MYYKKEENIYFGKQPEKPKKDFHTGHSVVCIETNKVYSSLIAAQRETGVCYVGISKCCSGKRKTAGGFHWKYS